MALKIWHISDTHGNHEELHAPDVDIVIHSGDAGNYRDVTLNSIELENFFEWYGKLDIKYKIYVAGNHDSSIEKRLISREYIGEKGIIYLENEEVIIEGLKIWGSPYTPTFNNWSFNLNDSVLFSLWK